MPNRPGARPRQSSGDARASDAAFAALLEDSAEELYEGAPCGYLSTLMDGTIAKINTRLLGWLGLAEDEVVGRMRFTDLLTVGGRLYHETHFAPLLQMRGEIGASPWRSDRPAAAGCRSWSPPSSNTETPVGPC